MKNRITLFSVIVSFLLISDILYIFAPEKFIDNADFFIITTLAALYSILFWILSKFFSGKVFILSQVIVLIVLSIPFSFLLFWGGPYVTGISLVVGIGSGIILNLFSSNFVVSKSKYIKIFIFLILAIILCGGLYDRNQDSSKQLDINERVRSETIKTIQTGIAEDKNLDTMSQELATISNSVLSSCNIFFHPGIKNYCVSSGTYAIKIEIGVFDDENRLQDTYCKLIAFFEHYTGPYPYPGIYTSYDTAGKETQVKEICPILKFSYHPS